MHKYRPVPSIKPPWLNGFFQKQNKLISIMPLSKLINDGFRGGFTSAPVTVSSTSQNISVLI